MRRDITAGEVTPELLSGPAFLDGEYGHPRLQHEANQRDVPNVVCSTNDAELHWQPRNTSLFDDEVRG